MTCGRGNRERGQDLFLYTRGLWLTSQFFKHTTHIGGHSSLTLPHHLFQGIIPVSTVQLSHELSTFDFTLLAERFGETSYILPLMFFFFCLFFRKGCSLPGVWFSHSTETCTAFKRAALDVLLAILLLSFSSVCLFAYCL